MNDKISFILNEELIQSDVNPAISLLDFIRNKKNYLSVKEGCREGDCGACTVLLGELVNGEIKYKNVVSCLFPLANVEGKHVVTLEGLNMRNNNLVQKAFIEKGAAQCGFCTPGFVVSATTYLINEDKLNLDNALSYVSGNICRCTGYSSIIKALNKLNYDLIKFGKNNKNSLKTLVEKRILPAYFLNIPSRLKQLNQPDKKYAFSKSNGKIIAAGGTDLYVQKYNVVINKKVHFLKYSKNESIIEKHKTIEISATTTFQTFKDSQLLKKYFPSFSEHLNLVASMPIRNMATLGGNIVNASPIGDLTIILIALGAEIVLIKGNGTRRLPLEKFFKGYKLFDLGKGEIIDKIIITKPEPDSLFNFEKVSKRKYLDIASVNSAAYFRVEKGIIKSVRISAGGVSPVPLFLKNTSEYLSDREITPSLLNDATAIIQSEISPISDVRGSEEYKRILLNRLFFAHFIELLPQQVSIEEIL